MKKKTANTVDFSPTRRAMRLTEFRSETDANGSYTGTPKRRGEKPVQDADDL